MFWIFAITLLICGVVGYTKYLSYMTVHRKAEAEAKEAKRQRAFEIFRTTVETFLNKQPNADIVSVITHATSTCSTKGVDILSLFGNSTAALKIAINTLIKEASNRRNTTK